MSGGAAAIFSSAFAGARPRSTSKRHLPVDVRAARRVKSAQRARLAPARMPGLVVHDQDAQRVHPDGSSLPAATPAALDYFPLQLLDRVGQLRRSDGLVEELRPRAATSSSSVEA